MNQYFQSLWIRVVGVSAFLALAALIFSRCAPLAPSYQKGQNGLLGIGLAGNVTSREQSPNNQGSLLLESMVLLKSDEDLVKEGVHRGISLGDLNLGALKENGTVEFKVKAPVKVEFTRPTIILILDQTLAQMKANLSVLKGLTVLSKSTGTLQWKVLLPESDASTYVRQHLTGAYLSETRSEFRKTVQPDDTKIRALTDPTAPVDNLFALKGFLWDGSPITE